MGRESSHGMKELLNLAEIRFCLSRQWDGYPLGLGLVAEDKPTEFSLMNAIINFQELALHWIMYLLHLIRYYSLSATIVCLYM